MHVSNLSIHAVKAILVENFDLPPSQYGGASGIHIFIKGEDGSEVQVSCYHKEVGTNIPVLKIKPEPGERPWEARYNAFKKAGC